ncbi:MAG TPA: DNA-formamidopyrimidine glycosylase family protein [Solirubrobacteraceae bacterium]|nr:DNA-formamidopyrimidine glycosylase family protein [Solirubrobacteraceae bacterium]
MPELPEVEATARVLDGAIAGERIAYAKVPGINALRSFEPPIEGLVGDRVAGVRRRGKHLIIDTEGGLALLIHLMSAGRLQLYETPASPRDRTSRMLLGLESGRELRLREFGSKQAAWVKLTAAGELEQEEALASLGPEAWPETPPLQELLDAPRPLHALLRDQHVIAGIGRSWVDEILWRSQLSPYKRGSDLQEDELERLREQIRQTLDGAVTHYETAVSLPIPDKLPMPLIVHRHEGEPCPRCASTLKSVHFEDYVIAYCPNCQTDGRVLKDRRLSRLLR